MPGQLFRLRTREGRRFGTALLLVCFLFQLLQIGLVSWRDPEASLPACCRSHGKHKCSMRMARAQPDWPSWPVAKNAPTLSESCPCLPAAGGSALRTMLALPLWHRELPPEQLGVLKAEPTDAFGLRPYSSHQKRGPPVISIAS